MNAALFLFTEKVYKCRKMQYNSIVATPILARKGGLTYGRTAYNICRFSCGKCSSLLHMQMVGQKRLEEATSLRFNPPRQNGIETPMRCNSWGFCCPYGHAYNIFAYA